MERKKLFSQRTLPWLGKVEQTDRNIDRETERESLWIDNKYFLMCLGLGCELSLFPPPISQSHCSPVIV